MRSTKQKKTTNIGGGLWEQLQRVSIPVFYGVKKMYQNWKAAFATCIDQALAREKYKMLQLHQCSGEALKANERLGHSVFAYQSAKERLERNYWGSRMKVIYLDELDNLRSLLTN